MKETASNTAAANTSSVSTSKEIVISVSDLFLSFGAQPVLQGISFNLYQGENLVILGKSGSGKSVLIKCIVQLLKAQSGDITVLGEKIEEISSSALEELRKKIGFLFQSGALYDSMNVRENLEFPLRRNKLKYTEQEIKEHVAIVLERVGLASAIDKMPAQLSGGMRKRISLARTLIIDPQIMLYDEPTTGLDPVTSNEISQLINQIQEQYKTSSIIITHDIACVRATAHRILLMHQGKIYKEGNLTDFETSDDPFIQSFFGKI